MVSRYRVKLPEGVTEEEATANIREHLKKNEGLLVMEDLLFQLAMQQPKDYSEPSGVPVQYGLDNRSNSSIYHQVTWNLVNRGVLYLPPRFMPESVKLDNYRHDHDRTNQDTYYGPTFRLTPHGEDWLNEEDSIFSCLPTEYGRFSEFLSSYAERFGDGYIARSREAVGCYKAKFIPRHMRHVWRCFGIDYLANQNRTDG